MVMKPVTAQAMIRRPGELTSRAISAETIKIPEPIMDPMTRVVALVSPSPLTSSPAPGALACAVFERSSADVGIFVLYVLLQNAEKILNCFGRRLKKIRYYGHRIGACVPHLSAVRPRDAADRDQRSCGPLPRLFYTIQADAGIGIYLRYRVKYRAHG